MPGQLRPGDKEVPKIICSTTTEVHRVRDTSEGAAVGDDWYFRDVVGVQKNPEMILRQF